MLLAGFLRRFVTQGHLRLIDADGAVHDFGEAGGEPSVTLRIRDRALPGKIARRPHLAVGEAYMNGGLTIEDGTIVDFWEVVGRNYGNLRRDGAGSGLVAWFHRNVMRPLQQHNPMPRARRNVAHHYDLSDDLFDLFLDDDRQYSCAYFTTPNNTLERAQTDKKRHIASKLLLEPGMKVLDIGSGWGGMGLYLAQIADVEVTGVTLSSEQHRVSNERAERAGLSQRVRFHLRDYRELGETYDRIVSVGMFEHVGARHYPEFFAKARDLLGRSGVMLLHSIGWFGEPSNTNPWIRKYIFPGGYTPSLSEVFASVERAGLLATDVEILKTHYAETLKHWHRRFSDNRARVRELYDERFCRMWEFYLLGSEASFRHSNHMVFQLQLARERHATPEVRDYMTAWERAHS